MKGSDQMAGSGAALVLGTIGLVTFVRWRQRARLATEAANTIPSAPQPKQPKPRGRA